MARTALDERSAREDARNKAFPAGRMTGWVTRRRGRSDQERRMRGDERAGGRTAQHHHRSRAGNLGRRHDGYGHRDQRDQRRHDVRQVRRGRAERGGQNTEMARAAAVGVRGTRRLATMTRRTAALYRAERGQVGRGARRADEREDDGGDDRRQRRGVETLHAFEGSGAGRPSQDDFGVSTRTTAL